MKALAVACGFWLCKSLVASTGIPSANIVDLPVPKDLQAEVANAKLQSVAQAVSEESLLDYRALMKEIHLLRQDLNQVRGEYQLELIAKEVVGKTFLLDDTIHVKRTAVVSNEIGLWFEPKPGVEVFLQMKSEQRKEFAYLSEYDFIRAKAICKAIGKQCRFELVSLEKTEPFDPQAEFVDFNKWIATLEAQRKGKTFFAYRDYMAQQSDHQRHRLGYVTGKFQSLTKNNKGQVTMTLLVQENILAKVECHPHYLEVLMNLQPESRVSMAVVLQRADTREGFFFNRGCLIRLKD